MRWFFYIACALLGLAGCRRANNAQVRFQNEFNCHGQVQLQSLGASAWRVRGCGRRATYVCVGGTCVRDQDAERDTPSGFRSGTTRAGRGRMRRGLAGGVPSLSLIFDFTRFELALLCQDGAGAATVGVSTPHGGCPTAVWVLGDGTTLQLERYGDQGHFSIPLRDLAEAADRQIGAVQACGVREALAPPEVGVLESFARSCAASVEADRLAPEVEPPAPVSSPGSAPAGHDEARHWLDARRELILGCTSGQAAFVHVRWGDDGGHISLGPPHAGTTAEACVAHALTDPPAAQGELIHAISP